MKDFYNSYKYDQDGNILELIRYNTRAIGPPVMDSLIYKYSAGTSVNDLLDDVYDCNDDAYDRDIHAHCPGSSPSRYTYDPVGNTTSDMVNAQDNIEWNIYNKVTKTENTTDTNKMFFQYNGMGNRVSKTFVGNIPNGSRKTTDYYYHDAQGNILATYKGLVESDTAGTVHKVGFSLASHDVYGSARLGTKEYGLKTIGMEVTIGLEPTDSLVDTMRLAKHVPWYSLEYQDDIHPDSLVPYDNHWKDSAYAWHRMGEKHYELSDHLGNVNVVISDARRVRTFDTIPGYPPYAGNYPIEVTSYKPERVALYDYYPFGMMMPERHMIDTTTLYRSGPITLDHFPVHRWYSISTSVFGSGCAPCAIDTMGTTRLSFATTGVTVIDTYRVSSSSTPIPDDLLYGNWNVRYRVGGMHPWRKNRIRIYINGLTQPTASHFWLDLYHTDYSTHLYSLPIGVLYGAPAVITATVQPTSLTAIDTAVIFSLGWKRMADTTTPHPPYDYSITIDSIVVDYDTIVQLHNIIASVSGPDGYNYGYNGKYKDNDWAGVGNHYDYGFRLYDPRICRPPSPDPIYKKFPNLSPYQFFSNSPIDAVDLDGKEAFFVHGTKSGPETWSPVLTNLITKRFTNNEHQDATFYWPQSKSYTNGPKDRRIAALALVSHIMDYRKTNNITDEEITLIGHSHGGNVNIQAARMLYEKYGISVNIINFNTPAYNGVNSDENPAYNVGINSLGHFYTQQDGVAGGLAGDDAYTYNNLSTIYQGTNIQLKHPLKTGLIDAHLLENINLSELQQWAKKPPVVPDNQKNPEK